MRHRSAAIAAALLSFSLVVSAADPAALAAPSHMPTFRGIYDVNRIRDVSEYITTVLPKDTAAAAKP